MSVVDERDERRWIAPRELSGSTSSRALELSAGGEEKPMFVRNTWYVAGWNYDFPAEGLTARTIINEPIVFYRKTDGALVALEDRCVHRLAPLSRGCREGDDLRCMYHGLKFAPSGRCIEIPGHDMIPERARVRSFPVVERHSWVWVWMGDPARADVSLIPDAIGLDDPRWTLGSGQLDYQASYQLINDNLLDFSHLSYVHKNSFGADEQWARTRPMITRLERGVRVERWIRDSASFRERGMRVDHWSFYDFLVPGILLLGGKVFPVGAAERANGKAPSEQPLSETFSCQAVTPVTASTSRYFFSWGPPAGEGSRAMADMLMGVAQQAFAEDKVIIEAQQRVIDRSPGVDVMPTPADRAVVVFQRLMRQLMRAEADGASQASGLEHEHESVA